MISAFIPSPSQGVWHLGPLPLRAYALCILAAIFLAIWLGGRRLTRWGGRAETVGDVAMWAVPFGIVGGRLYHVITSPEAYFGADGDPSRIPRIWEGGLGIWGAIALGAVGAAIGCRRAGVPLMVLGDAIAPGLLFGQGIGRLGNWFNQELFGRPTTLPWALQIDPQHRPDGYESYGTFHPTFLYELLWVVTMGFVLLWAERRYRLAHGQTFWAMVMLYTLGRVWIEALRIDTANHILGLRLNVWTSVIVFTWAAVMFVRSRRAHPDRSGNWLLPAAEPAGVAASGARQQPGGEDDGQKAAEPADQPGEQEQPPRHPDRAGEHAPDREGR